MRNPLSRLLAIRPLGNNTSRGPMASEITKFEQLDLAAPILQAIDHIGYETPSPIQAKSIPALLEGHDILGQAQTGTGKSSPPSA